MQKLLDSLKKVFDENARLTKTGEVRVNKDELSIYNLYFLHSKAKEYDVNVIVKRSGKGLVVIFKAY